MHMWAPDDARSLKHMAMLDDLLQEASMAAPDSAFLITADHGMNPKARCLDLQKICAENQIRLRFCVSPVADRLLVHHRVLEESLMFIFILRKNKQP